MFRIEKVLGRRHARIWSGGVLLVGALALYVTAGIVPPAVILGTSWLGAAIAYGLARRTRPRASDPATLAAASVVVPALGVLAILPLSLHFVLFASTGETAGFEWWIWGSAIFTAVSTIVTGILIGMRGGRLARELPMGRALEPAGIYFLGVAAGCVPGIVFVFPVLIIAVTGLAIVPFLHAMETVLVRERAMLADTEIPDAIAHFREAA